MIHVRLANGFQIKEKHRVLAVDPASTVSQCDSQVEPIPMANPWYLSLEPANVEANPIHEMSAIVTCQINAAPSNGAKHLATPFVTGTFSGHAWSAVVFLTAVGARALQASSCCSGKRKRLARHPHSSARSSCGSP